MLSCEAVQLMRRPFEAMAGPAGRLPLYMAREYITLLLKRPPTEPQMIVSGSSTSLIFSLAHRVTRLTPAGQIDRVRQAFMRASHGNQEGLTFDCFLVDVLGLVRTRISRSSSDWCVAPCRPTPVMVVPLQ